jgi:hemolysin III
MFVMINIYGIPGFTHPVSSIIHFVGAIFYIYLAYFLIRRGKGSRIRLISLAVFACSCVFLLLTSAVYHLLETSGTAHMVFQRLVTLLFLWSLQARLPQYIAFFLPVF